jgi:hypothetical protein
MKPKRKKRKVVAVAKRAVKKTSRVKVAPRKKRKLKMSGKKHDEDDEPGSPPKRPEPKTTEADPMGQPPDSPPNPNMPPEPPAQPTK